MLRADYSTTGASKGPQVHPKGFVRPADAYFSRTRLQKHSRPGFTARTESRVIGSSGPAAGLVLLSDGES